MVDYYSKYNKYKVKYLELKNEKNYGALNADQQGGEIDDVCTDCELVITNGYLFDKMSLYYKLYNNYTDSTNINKDLKNEHKPLFDLTNTDITYFETYSMERELYLLFDLISFRININKTNIKNVKITNKIYDSIFETNSINDIFKMFGVDKDGKSVDDKMIKLREKINDKNFTIISVEIVQYFENIIKNISDNAELKNNPEKFAEYINDTIQKMLKTIKNGKNNKNDAIYIVLNNIFDKNKIKTFIVENISIVKRIIKFVENPFSIADLSRIRNIVNSILIRSNIINDVGKIVLNCLIDLYDIIKNPHDLSKYQTSQIIKNPHDPSKYQKLQTLEYSQQLFQLDIAKNYILEKINGVVRIAVDNVMKKIIELNKKINEEEIKSLNEELKAKKINDELEAKRIEELEEKNINLSLKDYIFIYNTLFYSPTCINDIIKIMSKNKNVTNKKIIDMINKQVLFLMFIREKMDYNLFILMDHIDSEKMKKNKINEKKDIVKKLDTEIKHINNIYDKLINLDGVIVNLSENKTRMEHEITKINNSNLFIKVRTHKYYDTYYKNNQLISQKHMISFYKNLKNKENKKYESCIGKKDKKSLTDKELKQIKGNKDKKCLTDEEFEEIKNTKDCYENVIMTEERMVNNKIINVEKNMIKFNEMFYSPASLRLIYEEYENNNINEEDIDNIYSLVTTGELNKPFVYKQREKKYEADIIEFLHTTNKKLVSKNIVQTGGFDICDCIECCGKLCGSLCDGLLKLCKDVDCNSCCRAADGCIHGITTGVCVQCLKDCGRSGNNYTYNNNEQNRAPARQTM